MLPLDHIEAPLLRDLPLTNGNALVIGAYKGDTVRFLLEHHQGLKIFAFEPQLWAVQSIPKSERVRVFPYALGTHNEDWLTLYEFETDAASLIPPEGAHHKKTKVDMRDARQIFGSLALTKVDIAVVNIEGYEYELIPYLIHYGLPVERWLVQLHHVDRFVHALSSLELLMKRSDYTRLDIGKNWVLWTKSL